MDKQTVIDVTGVRTLHPNLSEEQLAKLVKVLEDEFAKRLTKELIGFLDKETSMEFAELTQKGDEKVLSNWIAEHIPDYEEIAHDEYDILMGDFAKAPAQFFAEAKISDPEAQ